MKFISKSVEGILFTVLFFSVVLPFGYALRKLTDPHCLKRHKDSVSYFNRRSTSSTSQLTPHTADNVNA